MIVLLLIKIGFDLGPIYFVTREKNYEDRDDSFMYYEIYDQSGKKIAETNAEFELTITDPKMNKKALEQKIDLEKNKKVIYPMQQLPGKDNEEPECIAMDKIDFDEKDPIKLAKDIKKCKDSMVRNKMSGKIASDKQTEKTEEEILEENKEKAEQEGGKKITKMKLIDDPFFYQIVPDATIKTYFVEYDDGSYGVMNGRGDDITGDSPAGALKIEKVDRANVENDETQGLNTDFAITIRGMTQSNGILFPIVITQGKSELEVANKFEEKSSTEINMAGQTDDDRTTNGGDELAINVIKNQIVEYLKKNGSNEEEIKEKEEKIGEVAKNLVEKGVTEPSDIDIEKEFKAIREQENEGPQSDRGERKKPTGGNA